MEKPIIEFGTSGHRGIMGKDFTLEHCKAIAISIARYVLKQFPNNPTLVVGYDSRLGNSTECLDGSYTKEVVSNLIEHGVKVWFCKEPTPTPCISWMVEHYGLQGGVILTASHNPPQYNGIKFNSNDGAPAPISITSEIQNTANEIYQKKGPGIALKKAELSLVDRIPDFCTQTLHNLSRIFGQVSFNFYETPVAIDAKHGAVGNTWKTFFKLLNLSSYKILHQNPRSDFGGLIPNPTDLSSLDTLKETQKQLHAPIACANDPDGDRHIILDELGNPLRPEESAAIIIDFFISYELPIYGIAISIASSHLIKKIAKTHEISLIETPVGFKHFTGFLKQGRKSNKTAFGIESSGGFTCSFHTLEKCGFLPLLLLLHILNIRKKTLSKLKLEIEEKYGSFSFREDSFSYHSSKKKKIISYLDDLNPESASEILELPTEKINRKDGCKIIFTDDSWILIRFSGTEPIARLYAESESETKSKELIEKSKKMMTNLL